MKKVIYILAALLLGGCSESFEGGEVADGASAEMCFAIAAEQITSRAGLYYTANLSEVGLYGYCTTADTPEIMANALFSKDASGDWSCSDAPTWSYEGSSDRFSFYGYAPYYSSAAGITAADDGTSFSIEYDMTDDYDLLLASCTDILRPAGGMVNLTFYHALAAISITLDDDYSNVEGMTLSGSMITAGSVSLESSTITWGFDSTAGEEVSFDISLTAGEYLMAIPQTLTSDLTVTISFSDNSTADATHTIPATTWEAGMIYSYTCIKGTSATEGNVIVVTDEDGNTLISDDDIITYITNTLGESDGEYTYFIIEGEISSDLMARILAIKTDDGGYVVTGLDLSNADITDLKNSGNGTELDDYSTTLKSWSQITTLVLPSTITSLGSSVYDNLIKSWKTIEVLDMSATSISTIGINDFKDMKDGYAITTIIFPATLTSIAVDAFKASSDLENIYFYSSGTITIGSSAFEDCGNLNVYFYHESTDVTLSVGSNAFDGRTNYYYYLYYYDDNGDIQFEPRTD
ncbi:MAG: fimbrillin family protein [Rikenellaceae bacterium]